MKERELMKFDWVMFDEHALRLAGLNDLSDNFKVTD